ncbi:MAG TPA: protein kinase [Ktedonobacterales bacterium]|jgi:serine/threonine protein kinase
MADRVGQQVGNYRLMRSLGEGGLAEVYLGEHFYLRTQAAIKIWHGHSGNEEAEAARAEARFLGRLVHPHIIKLLEFGMEGDMPFLVLSHAPNGSLRQRHPPGSKLSTVAILPYVKQIASALQYLHEQKIIHRGLNPGSCLLGSDNEIWLSGFGIAITVPDSPDEEHEYAGVPVYSAPEQFLNKPCYASDQYALGMMAYEWLAGEVPFTGKWLEVVDKKIHEPPPSLRSKVPTISPEVEEVVLTALAKDPKDRFASVKAFATAFEQAVYPPQKKPQRTQAFISYSHKDKAYLTRLHDYLDFYLPGRTLEVWDDTMIAAGTDWRGNIEQAIRSARVAVLLISFDFLRSKFIRENELPPLLRAAQQDGITILPIVLRPCPLEEVKELEQLQMLNLPSKTVSEMTEPEQERFWMTTTQRIRDALKT